jgi:hypothetical protein
VAVAPVAAPIVTPAPAVAAAVTAPAAPARVGAAEGEPPPAAKPWFKRPLILAVVPLVLVAGVVAVNASRQTTEPEATTAATPTPEEEITRINAEADDFQAKGTQADYEAAMKLFRQTAEKGDPYGQVSLGYMYDMGQGVPVDKVEAAAWYRLAADQGQADAQNKLGVLYYLGEGIEKDLVQAVAWFRKAADQGIADAQNNLGEMYRDGEGVPVDRAQARTLFQQAKDNPAAAEVDSDRAARNLANLDASAG